MLHITTVSSLDKVFARSGPRLTENAGSMLRNERYHFQICLLNDEYNILQAKPELSGDIAPYCTLRLVEHIPGQYTCGMYVDDYVLYRDDDVRLYPDLLRPLLPGDLVLRTGQWVSLWCTVHAPGGLPPGRHTLTFTLRLPDNSMHTVQYRIDVLDAMLPESDLLYTDWMHYDGIARWYREQPFTDTYYNILGTFIDTAVTHGMNMLYTPLFTPPLDTAIGGERMDVQLVDITVRDGGYTFDFKRLERFIDFAREHGIRYFEMCHLSTQWGARYCPRIMAHTADGYRRIFGWDTPALGEAYKRFLTVFLAALDDFLDKKGIKQDCWFHISDEPTAEQYDDYRKLYDYVRPLLSGYKLMDATTDAGNQLPDVPVISTDSFAAGCKPSCWVYYCCGQYTDHLSNRFFNMPSQRTRILGMQLYANDTPGFLHWGFNFYNSVDSMRPVNPFMETDAGGHFQSGDSFSVYPGPDGAWDSLRLEVFFDGLQDRSALQLLAEKLGKPAVKAMLAAEGISGYRMYPRSAVWHTAFRQRINRMIVGSAT